MNITVAVRSIFQRIWSKKRYLLQTKCPLLQLVLSLMLASTLVGCAPPAVGVSDGTSPAPPGQVNLGGFYDNTIYGFSIRFPANWTKMETGQTQPVIQIRAPSQFPLVLVSVSYISTIGTLKDQAASIIGAQKDSLNSFTQVSEGDLMIGNTPAYNMEYTWKSGNVLAKGRLVVVMRGSELYEIDIIASQSVYDFSKETTDAIVNSFQAKEPQPFGIPRSQALTMADDGPQTLDPALSRELRSHKYLMQIFSGLVTYDKDMNLVPDIADRWDISPDGRTYTFFLKHNVKFHNGKQVTANDFKYSWERAANPQTGSQTASTYLGDIVGVNDMLEGKTKDLVGVKVKDDYTLEVTTDAPKSYFLSKLFYPVAYVVDKDNVRSGGKEWWRKPNGTGPFKLKQWSPDELVILEKNPDYYRQPSSLNDLVFRLFAGIPMMMYETGDIDVVEIGGGDIERAKDPSNPLNKELVIAPELSLFYLGFNVTKPPFDDPLVRKAFLQAIDKDKVVRRALNDTLPRADGIVPPGMHGYQSQVKPLPFDPAQAKAALAASMYKDAAGLPPITLTMAGEGGDVSPAIGAIIDQWRVNLGVDVGVRLLEQRIYFYNLKKEKNELYNSGWIADYPDPQNFLDVLFRTGGEENTGGYSNPSVDAMLGQAAVQLNAGKRMDIYHQVEQKLVDDAAIISLWYGRTYVLVKPYVKGFVITPLGLPFYSNVSLQPH